MSTARNTSIEFEKLYKALNVAQKKAVDTIEGPVVVIAGPGTGKTTILTLRIANILKITDTAPENILALTFTESGAYAMRRKLTEIIGPAAYKVNIHTFHGFASTIIEQYPDYFPRIIGSTIITDADQIKIVGTIIKSHNIKILRPYGDPTYYVRAILNEIHILKRENISPDDLKNSIGDIPIADRTSSKTEIEKIEKRNEKNLELAWVYKRYEQELAKQKYYDFDDMLLELIRVMENNALFKLTLQENYQYVLADEHQDANAAQNRILELLADFHESPNLFIVGDDKQAIYRFQGASLDNFLYFSKRYPDVVIIDLTHNYRSHQGILDSAHSLIMNNPTIPGHVPIELKSQRKESRSISVMEFDTFVQELDHIAVTIQKFITNGESPEEIAILYRENRQAVSISQVLSTYGVAHRIESDHNMLEGLEAIKVIILCRAIANPADSELLTQALLIPEHGCDSAQVAELATRSKREARPLYRIIKDLPSDNSSRVKSADPRTVFDRIDRWSKESVMMPFPVFLQQLIQETRMSVSVVSSPDSLERLGSFQIFYEWVVDLARSKKKYRLTDFLADIAVIEEHGIMTKRTYGEHVPGVRLMTAHRSKGLEFDHVFIVNAIDGSWGNRIKRDLFVVPLIEHARDAGRVEDERRLFYVAMTRARESVTISYSRSVDNRERIPSQFLAEIEPGLISFERPRSSAVTEVFARMIRPSRLKKSASILDPSFVRSKFCSQPFSVTHLNNYLKCPWLYFFVNLVRLPQTENKHQMYGTAIHATLKTFFEAFRDGRVFQIKQLLDIFRHYLEIQALSADERAEAWNKGKRALTGYLRAYAGTWNNRLLTEYVLKGVEVRLAGKSSNASRKSKSEDHDLKIELTGKLDKIEFLNDHDVVVVDYKTGKPKSRNEIEGKTKDADGNYKRQLVFYQMLLNETGKFNMKFGELDFVEPNDRGLYKKERFEITSEDVEGLRKLIEKTASEIVNGSFIDQGCGKKECQYCKLGRILRNG